MYENIIKSIDNFLIKRGKIYLKPGEQPPKGVQVQRGRRGGMFYVPRLGVGKIQDKAQELAQKQYGRDYESLSEAAMEQLWERAKLEIQSSSTPKSSPSKATRNISEKVSSDEKRIYYENLQDDLFNKYPNQMTEIYTHLQRAIKGDPRPALVIRRFRDEYPELTKDIIDYNSR